MVYALLVFIGSGIGGVMRFGVNMAAIRLFETSFPWGTVTVNIVGSFVMGVLAAFFLARAGAPGTAEWRQFLTVGVLGGFTTFSSFSLDTVFLWERGALFAGFAYLAGSVMVSIAALFAGLWLVRALSG